MRQDFYIAYKIYCGAQPTELSAAKHIHDKIDRLLIFYRYSSIG